jgi:3',5'-cyclic-AMP phosphodiesterase
LAKAAQPEEDRSERGPLFRFAFMPDFHLRRDLRSAQGMEASLKAIMALDPKPAFIVTGGDLVHDMRSQTPEQCEEMADLFSRIWDDNTDLPTYHALGNHDVAGLTNEDFRKNHPLFGSNFLKEKLGLPGLNYSFDHGGWHFVVLHNVAITDDKKTIGEFTEDSLRFLREDLQRSEGMPVMLFGHYPPVTAIEFFNGNAKKKEEGWEIAYGRATRNPEALIEAIGEADVKAFFSGHIHRLDRIEAKGTTFICSGSVSGDKWKGKDVDTEEGFAVIDCYADGSFDYTYHDYGWDATPA